MQDCHDCFGDEVQSITHRALENWLRFLRRDNISTGVPTTTFLYIRDDEQYVKITCDWSIAIVEYMSLMDFAIELSMYRLCNND